MGSDIDLRRKNPAYHNWLVFGDALRIFCCGLRHYVEVEMKKFQVSLISKLGGAKCSCLSTPGVRPNPHERAPCAWAIELRKYHFFKKKKQIPWYQSDSSKWHDPKDGYWEIAKIFMSDLGSNNITIKDPSSSDSTCLLNLLYFCKHFNVQKHLVKSVRDWRNRWAHSPDHLLQDPDKRLAFDGIFHLLDDPELITCKEVQDCRKQIEDVRTSDISILLTNELRVLKEFKGITECESNHDKRRTRKQLRKLEKCTKKLHEINVASEIPPKSLGQNVRAGVKWSSIVIFFIIRCILVLIRSASLHFQGFLLMSAILQAGDKSMLSSYTDCSHATMKSPISSFQFQEFDFSSYLNYKRYNFFGRQWLFRDLEEVFGNTRGPLHGVLMIGEPGIGKSAVISELICSPFSSVLIHENVIGYHLCDYSEKGKRNGARFVRNLVDQIAASIPEFSNHVYADKQIHMVLDKRCESDPTGCFHNTVLGPLRELKNEPVGLRYILVDALDECIENDGKTSQVLDILYNKISLFPTWLKVILSSRNWTVVTDRIPRTVQRMPLDPSDERNLEDIQSYIKYFWFQNSVFVDRLLEAMGLTSTAEGRNSLINELSTKGEGNFLFIKTILQYLNESDGRVNLQSFPTSLYDTYDIYFRRQFDEENFGRFKPLFEVLIAASTPLRLTEIDSILKLQNDSFESSHIFKQISGILRFGHNETVQIYHQSFAEWLQEKKSSTGESIISKSKGHEYIADHLFHVVKLTRPSISLDKLTEIVTHISRSEVLTKYKKKLELMNISEIRNSDDGNCILHQLALNDDNAPILDLLLGFFESADIYNLYNMTPAFYAVSAGNVRSLKVLIENGIDVNYVMETPLNIEDGLSTIDPGRLGTYNMMHVASYEGHTNVVELLIKSNASWTNPSRSGLTPLHLAAEKGHLDIVKILYNAGSIADVIMLHHAAANNHLKVVQFLLETTTIRDDCYPFTGGNLPDYEHGSYIQKLHIISSETASYAAVFRGHTEMANLLLSFGKTDLECGHLSGKTVLMVAVERNDTELVKILLHAGANVETQCTQYVHLNKFTHLILNSFEREIYAVGTQKKRTCLCGEKAIHHCAKYGFWEIAKLLFEKDTNIIARDCKGFDPVHIAMFYDHVDFVHNFNLTLMEKENKFMVNKAFIHHAAWCGSYKTLKLLSDKMSHGDIFIANEEGKTPLHYVGGWSPYPNSGISELKICSDEYTLLENCYLTGGDVKTIRNELSKRLASMKLLVETQEDRFLIVNLKDKTGKSALHYAAMAGFADALKYLVNHGGDSNAIDNDGNTPLALALAALPNHFNCFLQCHRTYDKLFRVCNTTMFDSTVQYLIWLKKSKIKECNKESETLSAEAMKKKMPLTLYTLLKLGSDVKCGVSHIQRAFVTHFRNGGQQISEVFKLLGINITVECNVPFQKSELHLISHFLSPDDHGNFFKPVNNRSILFQRLVVNHQKGIQIFNECRDEEGHVAIHRAAEGGNSDAVEWLISQGVDTSLKTGTGLTALDLSILFLQNEIHRKVYPFLERKSVPDYILSSHRFLTFEKLLMASLKAMKYDWYSSWCNPKHSTLSPLHLAATEGKGMLNFVYKKTQEIASGPSLEGCKNIHGVTPHYLAQFYDSFENYRTITYHQLSDRKIERASVHFPDREAEYHIIFNRMFESSQYRFGTLLAELKLNVYTDEVRNCPDFYDLVPDRRTLSVKISHCGTELGLNFAHIFPRNIIVDYLVYRFHEWSLINYRLQKRGLFILWLQESQVLKRIQNCYCGYVMQELQISLMTMRSRNVGELDTFTRERMGWKNNSAFDEVKYRWPFYFLFKKATGQYESYDYLTILNSGLDISYGYYGTQHFPFLHSIDKKSLEYIRYNLPEV